MHSKSILPRHVQALKTISGQLEHLGMIDQGNDHQAVWLKRSEMIKRRHKSTSHQCFANKDIIELLELLQDRTFYEKYGDSYLFCAEGDMESSLSS